MTNFKKYNLRLLCIYFLVLIALCVLAAYLRPLTGDLTRIGGYLENFYGWQDPQREFSESLYKQALSTKEYDRHYDIVVIGDSFSRRTMAGWQNYLVNSTGYSLISFDWEKTQPKEIIQSEYFKKSAPKLFIYESIEHGLFLRNSQCEENHPNTRNITITRDAADVLSPLNMTTNLIYPDESAILEGDFNIGSAANYAVKMLARNILNMNLTFSERFEITRNDLFSNKDSNQILIHKRRFLKSSVSDTDVLTIQCNLLNLQSLVQSNQETYFLVMPIPDKLSAYSDYLVDRTYADISFVHKIPTPNLNVVPLNIVLEKAIKNGVKDVYLPNDTHWGSVGYHLASDAIVDHLVDTGNITFRDIRPSPKNVGAHKTSD